MQHVAADEVAVQRLGEGGVDLVVAIGLQLREPGQLRDLVRIDAAVIEQARLEDGRAERQAVLVGQAACRCSGCRPWCWF